MIENTIFVIIDKKYIYQLVPKLTNKIYTIMNTQSISDCAKAVWRLLHGDNRKWEYQELKGNRTARQGFECRYRLVGL